MYGREHLLKCIANRSTKGVVAEMFEAPEIKPQWGYFNEGELWDYKQDIPAPGKGHEAEWAKLACDVLAFHNNKGGVLVFGIRNHDFVFVGATHLVDTKLFNDKMRRYIGDRFWVSFSREAIRDDQCYLGIAIVPPRSHTPLYAMADGPTLDGKPIIKRGDYCLRVGDETRVLRGSAAIKAAAESNVAGVSAIYAVDEGNYRVLRPDYRQFVYRDALCRAIDAALYSPRTFITSLTGIGGVGKTALASWATLKAYEARQFDFIVSTTAKDRGLSTAGIVPLTPTLTSLADLLRAVCETTGFFEYLEYPIEEQVRLIQENILSQFKGLLLVDNLETVDDPRIISFLESLPLPTRAIVTSRKARVRVACQPLDVGAFTDNEAINFLNEVSSATGKHFFSEMTLEQKHLVISACDRIPLVIEWFLGRGKSKEKALSHAATLVSESKHGDELVEFCFRRVYSEFTERQRSALKVLALIGRPLPIEAIAAGAAATIPELSDDIEELKEYSVVEREYDNHYRDLVYSLLPVTTTFVCREVYKAKGYEDAVRKRLTDWYQAREIKDPVERQLMQKVRRGERNPELAYLHVAKGMLESNNPLQAQKFFELGLERNPRNYELHWGLAEFYRQHKNETGLALSHYEQACEHAPKHGRDRGKVFRECGILLKSSGMPDANRLAIEKLKIALDIDPRDRFARHALGDSYVKIEAYLLAAEILGPLLDHPRKDTRDATYRLLQECYAHLNDQMALAKLHEAMRRDGITPRKERVSTKKK
jgi:tetratricopeptide (TPR) repeat protein